MGSWEHALRSIRLAGLPRRSTVFPLVVRELLDLAAIVAHDKDLAVRLWCQVCVEHLVFKYHPAACEYNTFAIWRPRRMRVVALRARLIAFAPAIRSNLKHVEVVTNPAY